MVLIVTLEDFSSKLSIDFSSPFPVLTEFNLKNQVKILKETKNYQVIVYISSCINNSYVLQSGIC